MNKTLGFNIIMHIELLKYDLRHGSTCVFDHSHCLQMQEPMPYAFQHKAFLTGIN